MVYYTTNVVYYTTNVNSPEIPILFKKWPEVTKSHNLYNDNMPEVGCDNAYWNNNKGCTREFLYIRNSHPRLKLTLIAEKCTAGMHVNTHSCPLRTQKLTIIHGFLPRLTLTSEGGELVNPQKTKIHNETQKICVISLRRSRGRMILNARKC